MKFSLAEPKRPFPSLRIYPKRYVFGVQKWIWARSSAPSESDEIPAFNWRSEAFSPALCTLLDALEVRFVNGSW